MTQGEGSLIDGAGSQTLGTRDRSRWGDYTSMEVDPADDCTLWYVNEYLPSDGPSVWHTRIGSFSLPGCGTTATDDFSLSTAPWTSIATAGECRSTTVSTAITAGSAPTVAMSAPGLPAGVPVSFNPPSVTAGQASQMTVTTDATTTAGTYQLAITGTSAEATHTTPYALTVNNCVAYLSVNDLSINEGSTTKTADFTVTRSGDLSRSVAVNVATANGNALAGSDYVAVPTTTVNFAVGQKTQIVPVTINGDTVPEPDKTFQLRLSSPVGAVLSDDTGVATIVNDDAAAYFSINDVSINEGNSATRTATFTVTRSGNASGPASVTYRRTAESVHSPCP